MGKKGDILRAEISALLNRSERPQSAYDILAGLREFNPKIAPTTVYRALNSLTEDGAVHRLESLNAYVLCQGHEEHHEAILSICDDCGNVEETVAPDVLDTMAEAVAKSGFAPARHVVELHGTCSDCSTEKHTS